jgi:hypothetical protein
MGDSALRRLITVLMTGLMAGLISVLILLEVPAPAQALSLPWSRGTTDREPVTLPAAGPSGRLQEVAAPGAVQQLRRELASHQPRLSLEGPSNDSVLNGETWTLKLRVEDWPAASDPELGLGAHIALQIDGSPPQRFSQVSNGHLQAQLPALSPGSHRLSAYAAYPWGEAVKTPGASLNWRLHQAQALEGTQPEQNAPWLELVSPSELSAGEPLLLDWLIWNAPLQNLRAGDARWRLRLTLNGDSFLMDRQEALWIRGQGSGNQEVQMELLDSLGEPITPVFNNQLRVVTNSRGKRPVWMQSNLSGQQLARLLGQALPEQEPAPKPAAIAEPEADPIVAPSSEQTPNAPAVAPQAASPAKAATENGPTENASNASTAEPPAQNAPAEDARAVQPDGTDPGEEQPSSPKTSPQQPPAEQPSKEQPATRLIPRAEPPPLAPTTSLGGSARELLNADGTQR